MNTYQKQLLEKLIADTQEKLTPTAKAEKGQPRNAVLIWNLLHGRNYKYSYKDYEAIFNHLTTQP